LAVAIHYELPSDGLYLNDVIIIIRQNGSRLLWHAESTK